MAEQLGFGEQVTIIAKLVVCVTPPVVASQIFHASYFLTGIACIRVCCFRR